MLLNQWFITWEWFEQKWQMNLKDVVLCCQVFQLVCHLVYWAKATVIYPLCETNVYVLSPQANTLV